MNVILRGSILYASECYYNLTENEIRRIERIEERYLRKIFQTPKTCPIVQLYLEFGQWPARFEIQKMRCLYLKTILSQKEHSQIFMFFKLQKESPIKGDWVSTVMKDLSDLRIYETMDEIKEMSRNKFKNLIKCRIEVNALDYLHICWVIFSSPEQQNHILYFSEAVDPSRSKFRRTTNKAPDFELLP